MTGEMRDIHKYQKCQQKSADSQLPTVGAPCASMQVVTADPLTSHQLHLATTACSFCFTIFQNPDNVIFVMDATIGQACESQVNFMFLTALI